MGNLIHIQNQIEKLQKQANDVKAGKFDATVKDTIAKMRTFGIVLRNLQAPKARARKGKAIPSKKSSEKLVNNKGGVFAPANYRGPRRPNVGDQGCRPRACGFGSGRAFQRELRHQKLTSV
jgi:DNA-binding protein H-NS